MAEELKLSFAFLSDPQLATVAALGARTSTGHPMARTYPRKAFLQPSVVMLTQPSCGPAFKWVMKPSLFNLFGAARRMTPEDIVARARVVSQAAAKG